MHKIIYALLNLLIKALSNPSVQWETTKLIFKGVVYLLVMVDKLRQLTSKFGLQWAWFAG